MGTGMERFSSPFGIIELTSDFLFTCPGQEISRHSRKDKPPKFYPNRLRYQ